jgi:hypothetical protein
MGFGASLFLIATGAILDFAVKVQTNGFNLNKIGLILMIVGAIGLVLSLLFWGSWGGFGGGGYRRTSRISSTPPVDNYGRSVGAPAPGTSGTTEYVQEQRY